jgi:hypothetical protein
VSQQRSSYRRSASGLVGAMIMALLTIAFVWGLTRFQHRDVDSPVTTVDYAADLTRARSQAPFEILAPDRAPEGWRPTSVSWDGVGPVYSWHLGFLTSDAADAEYVGLEQGNAGPAEILADSTVADQPAGTVDIGGDRWEIFASSDGDETALVLEGGQVTTVVTGTAPQDALVVFVESLSPN